MKKLYTLIFLLFFVQFLFAQNVDIPDANLKNYLVNLHSPTIDTNGDGEIQVSEAEAMDELSIGGMIPIPVGDDVYDLTGIEAFVNITELSIISLPDVTSIDVSAFSALEDIAIMTTGISTIDLSQNILLTDLRIDNNNGLTSIDVSALTELEVLRVSSNNLTDLDISENSNLVTVMADHNQLTSLNTENNPDLNLLQIYENYFTEIDVSNNPNLTFLNFFNNSLLTNVNLKNGNTANIDLGEGFLGTPNLETVCVDDEESLEEWTYQQAMDLGAVVTTDCEFDATETNKIIGVVKYDIGEGCEDNSALAFPQVPMKAVDENGEIFIGLTDDEGNYIITVGDGDYTISLGDIPEYYTSNPGEHNSSFSDFSNVDIKDFCVEANQEIEDLKITLVYKPNIRFGEGAIHTPYTIVIENNGTETVNGEYHFEIEGDYFKYNSAEYGPYYNQDGLLKFNLTNLKPFHSETYKVYLGKVPGAEFEIGDIHEFTLSVFPIDNDVTPEDNMMVIEDTILAAYDPNNKIVWEGEEISLEEAEDFLHYTVNFQNTGNANADRVKVTDTLSNNLNIESLQMLSSSHDYEVEIEVEEEEVLFHVIFNNIDLTYEDADEEESQGFFAYKIKPKEGVEIGDIFSSPADIFFDDNPPIRTNVAITEIVEDLSVDQPKLVEQIAVYPNPTTGMVYLDLPENIEIKSVEIFTLQGKMINKEENVQNIDLTSLSTGMYFLRITDQKGKQALKRILKK